MNRKWVHSQIFLALPIRCECGNALQFVSIFQKMEAHNRKKMHYWQGKTVTAKTLSQLFTSVKLLINLKDQ